MKYLFIILSTILFCSCNQMPSAINKRSKIVIYRGKQNDTLYLEYYNNLWMGSNSCLYDNNENRFTSQVDNFSVLSTDTLKH